MASLDEREILRTVPLFAALSPDHIDALLKLVSRRHVDRDGVIFFENEVGDTLFMIRKGRVKVSILGDDGREVILSLLGPGDFFGEMALLDDEPRSATAIAGEDCELLTLTRAEFNGLRAQSPEIVDGLVHVLANRLRRANQQISTLALLDVAGRVARVVLDMAREEGRRLKDGSVEFRRATHQEIANRIGTSRETVTRMLKDMERHGLIHVEGKTMIVAPDFERVFDLVE